MEQREIKFRGISIIGNKKDEWVYGYYYECSNGHMIVDVNGLTWVINRETLGMYTGRKDRNSIEIYEADIVGANANECIVVRWDKRYCCFEAVGDKLIESEDHFEFVETSTLFANELEDSIDTWGVIGNIYQHPHLLNNPQ